jgi:endonuclease YncB( thermonuclease family)
MPMGDPVARLLAVLTVAFALALTLAGTAAAQGPEPCVPGTEEPICQFELGGVTFVADGDTIDVDLADDGTATPVRVRITGIQAMEQSVYSHDPAKRRGDCHALEATARLEELIRGSNGVVRLASQHADSRSKARLLRSVQVLVGGQWQDVGRILVSEGHALWLASGSEWAWNRTLSQLSQQAARAGVGLWSTTYCGAGPDAALRLWVHWDADGNDTVNYDDEWVRIQNLDTTAPVSLDGWWLRDSGLRRFTFPAGTVVDPGATVTVRVGAANAPDLGWNLTQSVFDNATSDERAIGDGAYLFDPEGDLRAWQVYPCREACTDAAAGAFDITVTPSGRETIALRNTSEASIALDGYEIATAAHTYAFRDAVVGPGETLRLRVGGSPGDDSRLERHWGSSDPLLRDGGDAVRLMTFDSIVIACASWGSGRCASP